MALRPTPHAGPSAPAEPLGSQLGTQLGEDFAPLQRAAEQAREAAEAVRASFGHFLERYREAVANVFGRRGTADAMNLSRGMPPFVLAHLRETDPLSCYVPAEYGGRGGHVREGLAMLEATSYGSLPLSLLVGINGGLFLQPLAKYGTEAAKRETFAGVLRHKRMGGLMITEPDFGTAALQMQTAWEPTGRGTARITGTKHWAGLTGWADYWVLTARERGSNGKLRRDVDLFIADVNRPEVDVHVEEVYNNLGLRMLPYGRNRIDAEVGDEQRLVPDSTGVKMLLDLLHRSRLQFPGMGLGFLRRMADEAMGHARERFVGGKPLLGLDQVRARVALMQAQATATAAMCLYTAEHAGTDRDLSGESLRANAVKATVTDWMQDAAQSLVQLCGAKGYRADHIAGRALVDSRPYQIFEGSNDVLYIQVAEAVAKGMRRFKGGDLGAYLAREGSEARRAAESMRGALAFDVDLSLPQRKLTDLGRAVSRMVAMEMTMEMGERGFPTERVEQALDAARREVLALLESVRRPGVTPLVEAAPNSGGEWLALTRG